MTDLDKYPCDRHCNWADGPAEDCSKHGRPPAEVWQIVGDVSARLAAALARIAKVEALHSPRTIQVVTGDCALGECEHDDECPTEAFEQCVACEAIADRVSIYYEEENASVAAYPCATVRALTEGDDDAAL